MLDNRLPRLLYDAGIADASQAQTLLDAIQATNQRDFAPGSEPPGPPEGYEIPQEDHA